MHQRFLERLEAGLQKLDSAMRTGHEEGLDNRSLGRLLEKNVGAGGVFDVRIGELPEQMEKARLKITWQRHATWDEWARIADGCYILRSNLCDVDPVPLWRRYIQLTKAEWDFRLAKDELSIRPVWHQKDHRVRAHILVCFSPMSCGRHRQVGWGDRVSTTPLARCWRSSPRSRAATLCSEPDRKKAGRIERSAYFADRSRTLRKRYCYRDSG